MGMWDWLEQQYPAPGTRAEKNGFPPLSASDTALLRLIAQGVAAGAQTKDDDPRAAQAARETGAAATARAVKPPYGRDEGWLTQAPENLLQSLSPLLKRGYPAWPSPSNPVSPMSTPASPVLFSGSTGIDEPSESQAARDAGAATLARAARHPYGRRLFASAAAQGTQLDTEGMRQAEGVGETWAQRLANAMRRPNSSPVSPPTEGMRLSQEAYEAAARRIANAAKPIGGRKEGKITEEIVDHWPLALLVAASVPTMGMAIPGELALHSLYELLNSTRPAK